MQDIKRKKREGARERRELRDSGSNPNTKICFEVRATALRPRLHTEGFPLESIPPDHSVPQHQQRVHTRTPWTH